MTRSEDLVRSTVSAIAETVRDVPPLRLSPAPAPDARASAPRQRRRRSWLAPAAAAAAVLAIAVSAVVIKNLPADPAAPATGSTAAASVPAYYAAPEATCKTCKTTRLVVGDTFTGAKLASFDAPRGTRFAAVSAAADDRTFVADTVEYPFSSTQHVTWYLLKIAPGAATPARLTRLRIPNTPAPSVVGDIALSPSGSELAVTYGFNRPARDTAELRIYSVTTGKLLNSWSAGVLDIALSPYGFSGLLESNNLLSWTDGGRAVSFTTFSDTMEGHRTDVAMRVVSVAARGGELVGDSRVVWSTQNADSESYCADGGIDVPELTADGKTVVCGTGEALGGTDPSGKRAALPLAWLAYRTSEPEAARTLYKFTAYSTGPRPLGVATVQWSDTSGSTLIVAWVVRSKTMSALHFGVISHGSYTPLPTPPGAEFVAW